MPYMHFHVHAFHVLTCARTCVSTWDEARLDMLYGHGIPHYDLQVASTPSTPALSVPELLLQRITSCASHFIENCYCEAWNKLISINPYSLLYCYYQVDRRERVRFAA